jgi:syntaxin 1B/2/3
MGRDDYNGESSCPTVPTNSISYRPHQSNIPPLLLGQNVEMASLTQNGSQFGRQGDPNAILNECREIDNAINEIENVLESEEFRRLRDKALRGTDPTTATTQLAVEGDKIVKQYQGLSHKLKTIKQKPESGSPRNAPQVGKVDRRLKNAIRSYREKDNEFTNELRDQAARQYRLVHPDASQAEVNEFVEDPGRDQQVFASALMRTGRSGQATTVENAVRQRSDAIKQIESQMMELADLFNDMDNLVVQQEAAVVNIEQKGEEVVENMDKGTEQIGVAIKSARNRNKLKWWCLGITSMSLFAVLLFHAQH